MAKIKKFNTEGKKMGFEAIPAGEYLAEVIDSEWKDTQSGGEMLILTFSILKGDQKGKTYKERLNLVNENRTTVEIAEGVLADLNRAAGYGEKMVKDTDQYNKKPITIKLGTRETKEYGTQNNLLAITPKGKGGKKDKEGKGGDTPVWADDSKKDKKKDKEGKKDKKDKSNKKDKKGKKGKK